MSSTILGGAATCSMSTASATRFHPIGMGNNGALAGFTTEAEANRTCREAGVLSKLGFRVSANGRGTTTTVRTRKNGANGNQSVAVTASSTGWFEDTTNSDSLAAGDTFCLSTTTGTGTGTFTVRAMVLKFLATSSCATVQSGTWRNSAGMSFTTASVTRFAGIYGNATSTGPETTEANVQSKAKAAGTSKRCQVYAVTNSRTTDSTVRFRKNGADGNQVVTITASTTGLFEDTTNTDSIAVDDLVNWSVTNGSGAGTLTLLYISHTFLSSGTDFDIGSWSQNSAHGLTVSVANYFYVWGDIDNASTTENDMKMRMPVKARFDKLRIRIGNNSATNNVPFTLRVNGSSSSLSATITASTTGLFEDTTNSVIVSAGDDVNFMLDSPNNVNVGIDVFNVRLDTAFDPQGTPNTVGMGAGTIPGAP